MRILDLTLHNFRGFGSPATRLVFESDLVLLYGLNGAGKTSLVEGIEWLFYGTTKRRLRGESYSKLEYTKTFANVHAGLPVEVSATILMPDARSVVLTRIMVSLITEETVTLINGEPASFQSIGLLPIEAEYPVVAQHALQTFIHSKPKDRRDAISAAFGLEEITALKTALDGARYAFQRTPPSAVMQARRELTQLAPVLASLPETRELAGRWAQSPPQVSVDADLRALMQAARTITDGPVDSVEEGLALLRLKRTEAGRAVFDTSKLEPPAPADLKLAAVATAGANAAKALAEVERSATAAVAQLSATIGIAWLEFWQRGLVLAPDGQTCPMCDALTLTQEQRGSLKRRIHEGQAAIVADKDLADSLAAAKGAISSIRASAHRVGVVGVNDLDAALLRRLFKDDDSFEAFLPACRALTEKQEKFEAVTQSIESFLDKLPDALKHPEQALAAVAEANGKAQELADALNGLTGAVEAYRPAWASFEKTLITRIASQETVARIDAVGKALKAEPGLRLLARYEVILGSTHTLLRSVEAFLQAKQISLLTTRGEEVKQLYDLMNPGAPVGFEGMEPGTDQMKLHAISFGKRMPAAANLSECQLNCLGLAVSLMRATTPSSPFGFIVLDDPVQSMDDDHTEAFIASVVPALIDEHVKQVIVLSHVQRVVDRLRDLNLGRPLRVYHYENYHREGPVITEQVKLAQLLAEVRGLANGNERNREMAVDRLRVLVEHFIRELHLRKTGHPTPAEYDRATTTQLLKLYQTIPDTTPTEYAGMRDTVDFADPAHHSEVGYAVPSNMAIRPHIDRLNGLMQKYKLL